MGRFKTIQSTHPITNQPTSFSKSSTNKKRNKTTSQLSLRDFNLSPMRNMTSHTNSDAFLSDATIKSKASYTPKRGEHIGEILSIGGLKSADSKSRLNVLGKNQEKDEGQMFNTRPWTIIE